MLNDCKQVAAKRRRQSTRLENLGIPEEELLRQQQELFARARQEQMQQDQAEWMEIQSQSAEILNKQKQEAEDESDESDY